MQSERTQLERRYAQLSDEGVKELAVDAPNLTELAREVLRVEISKRGMQIELPTVADAATEEPAKISGPLVMVKRYRDLPEAFVARSILDSAEIDSFLADENLVRIDWLYSNLIGGAKLMVRPEDAETATALLNESENEINAARELEMNSTQSDSGEEKK
jgi:hypothetical protein